MRVELSASEITSRRKDENSAPISLRVAPVFSSLCGSMGGHPSGQAAGSSKVRKNVRDSVREEP